MAKSEKRSWLITSTLGVIIPDSKKIKKKKSFDDFNSCLTLILLFKRPKIKIGDWLKISKIENKMICRLKNSSKDQKFSKVFSV